MPLIYARTATAESRKGNCRMMAVHPGYRLVRLANGVWSVHALAEGETFHPVIGPVAEAEALYVRQLRLNERLGEGEEEFVIWDVGLGAGANALTVLRATRATTRPLRLVSFDTTPTPLQFGLEHADALGYFTDYADRVATLLDAGECRFTDGARSVHWKLHLADFPTLVTSPLAARIPKPHTILFDAYSPARNPAMWSLPLFTALYRLLDPLRPCALPTYSRSTLLRVTLLLAGFYVGTGQPTGEKEETTLAANTPMLIDRLLDHRWLQRARRSSSAEPLSSSVYRQAPLSAKSWDRLRYHPQFR